MSGLENTQSKLEAELPKNIWGENKEKEEIPFDLAGIRTMR